MRYFETELYNLKTELGKLIIKNHQQGLRIEELIQENSNLVVQNKMLIKQNIILVEENKILKNQLIKLQDKLNINSSNSGLPTSKDIYKLEKHKPKSGLKPGGQPGHKPSGYQFKTPDKIVAVFPQEEVCKCGGKLFVDDDYSAHQKIEIPEVQPIVTEYHLRSSRCNVCAKTYSTNLNDYKLLGKNAESIITSLGGFFNNSKREIQSILSQIFNLDISLGLISSSESRVSDKLASKYNELVEVAENSEYLHLDETSHNNKGKRGWCWWLVIKQHAYLNYLSQEARKH